ncbi:hypothetical protein PHYPSEUDO_005326 [Phytophthora pseudosyringae]|uniref:Uncharacterized protein n=1 Tax=Phytophthora pseudosyringae TaxID=221518 RepID=A0A8T1VPV4_9STRA|nr:hypothetical protein PHYPSEUDO_005326 [Phytophthora pseudosyringae]
MSGLEHDSMATADLPNSSELVQDWAALTTETWAKEVQMEWKLKQRRETLARFRVAKKKKVADMRNERDRLELEVKRRLAALHEAASHTLREEDESNRTSDAVCQLALESDALRNENDEIYEKLQQHKRSRSLILEGLMDMSDTSTEHTTDLNLHEASKQSEWASYPLANEPGWRVLFPNGEPSFYFYPFSRDEFVALYEDSIDDFLFKPLLIHPAGTLFGWAVRDAPLTRRPVDNLVLVRTSFSMRAGFLLEDLDQLVLESDLKWLPLIVTPPNWNDRRRKDVSYQVLQEFETDAYIMACSFPGKVHTRYLHLVRRQPWTLPNGKRATTYFMTIVDSKANARSRTVEEPRDDVVWAREGANMMMVTEVDENTVEIRFEFKAACRDELHARHLFVHWTQFVCRWSQRIMPPKLLEPGE